MFKTERCDTFVNLPRRVADALIAANILTWKQVYATSDADLLKLDGIGPSALKDIRREQWLEGFLTNP
jgi:hypothetical protein